MQLPISVRSAVVLVAMNAWPTAARYQERGHSCLLGCSEGEDRLEHYLVCPAVRHPAMSFFGIDGGTFGSYPVATVLQQLPLGDMGVKTALFIDCLYFAFLIAKHHAHRDVTVLFATRLKRLVARQDSLRRLLDL